MADNKKVHVPGELEVVTVDGKLAPARQIYDETYGKFQSELNSEMKSITDQMQIAIDGGSVDLTSDPNDIVEGSGKVPNANAVALKIIASLLNVDQQVIEDSTNPVSGGAVFDALSQKQGLIEDLQQIRENAQLGAEAYHLPENGIPASDLTEAIQLALSKALTALQTETDPTVPSWAKQPQKPAYDYSEIDNTPTNVSSFQNDANYATKSEAQGYANAESERAQGAELGISGRVQDIEGLIPNQATTENKLADKDFVNSSIASNTGEFRGTFTSFADLASIPNPKLNDYAYVVTTVGTTTTYNRYKYASTGWGWEYALNNSSFTAEQWAAIQSGITAALVEKLSALPTVNELISSFAAKQNVIDSSHLLDADLVDDSSSDHKFVSSSEKSTWNNKQNAIDASHKLNADLVDDSTSTNKFTNFTEKSSWNSKYDKPQTGIPSTDMEQGVQNTLDAVAGKADKSEMSITQGTGADSDKTTIQLKSGTSTTVLTQHQDISGKQDVINDLQNIRNGAAAGAVAAPQATTYTKTEVNGLVDTPHQNYVTVSATSQTTAATDVLPASGQAADTIYRVSNWDGSANSFAGAFDVTCYSEYAWDGSQYVFLCVKSQIGEVFDISVYNNNAKYADLAAALNGGANIPQSLQKGGMSVKFVQSSDNKYVQFRLKKTSFSINVKDWEEDNIVSTSDIFFNDASLDFADEEDNVVLRLQNGHIKTKNFDSEINNQTVSEIEQEVNNIPVSSGLSEYPLTISDENDNDIVRFNRGHIRTKNFNSENFHKLPANILYQSRPATGKHCFSVSVNCYLFTLDNSLTKQDQEVNGTDYGFVALPENYSPTGEPTRLIIYCHGTGATLASYQNPNSVSWSAHYECWLKLGFAFMDMYAAPTQFTGSTTELHLGNPTVLQCYRKGYEYVQRHFNIKRDGIFVIGGSMGGLSSLQICMSGMFPVIGYIGYCPVCDLYKQAYLGQWNPSNRQYIANFFNFAGKDQVTFTSGHIGTAAERQIFKDNIELWKGFNPILMNADNELAQQLLSYVPSLDDSESWDAVENQAEAQTYKNLKINFPVPAKIFHCENDTTVLFRYSKYLVDAIRRGGGQAWFRPLPSGGHGAWATGEDVSVVGIDGQVFTMKASTYEAYLFIKRLNNN